MTREERLAKNRDRARASYAANPEMYRERARARRSANLEKARERARTRRATNPERSRELQREWRAANPERYRELQREWRAANRERYNAWRDRNRERIRQQVRNKTLIRKYGMTSVCFEVFAAAHGNVCAVCGQAGTEKKGLCIDHDHREYPDGKMRVRGLLCNRCNSALGLVDDDPTRLRDLAGC